MLRRMWNEAESANIEQVTGEARPELKVGEKAGQRDVLARCGWWRAPVGGLPPHLSGGE